MRRRVGLVGALTIPLAAAAAVGAVLAGPAVEVSPAAAQAQNRAAVIVDTGGGTAAVCVRFAEPSITGLDALQRAGLGAVVRSFSGQGAAVCGLNGVGCPADDSCLTCAAPNYWAYHRAPPGAGGFTFSSAGAGSTAVTDGSVEGWQWGTGAAPPFQTVDQVCGAPEPPPPPPSGGGSAEAPAAAAPAAPEAGPAAPTSTTTPVATTTTVTPPTTGRTGPGSGDDGPADEVDGDLASVDRAADADDGGSPWATAVFVVVGGAIAVGAVVIRRRRTV